MFLLFRAACTSAPLNHCPPGGRIYCSGELKRHSQFRGIGGGGFLSVAFDVLGKSTVMEYLLGVMRLTLFFRVGFVDKSFISL